MFFSKFSVLRQFPKKSCLLRNVAYCPEAISRPLVVTIIGGNTGEGQLTALLLKQSKLVDEIRLYSGLIETCGIALDLSHINTNPVVKSYTGQALIKEAITDAQVILVCGGHSNKPCRTQEEIFDDNADYVRNAALYVGEFCPKAILCISTPPVNFMVPMVAEELKKANGYDPRKLFGICNAKVMMSNSLLGKYQKKDPSSLTVPIVGGVGRDTTVCVFSQVKPCSPVEKALAALLQEKIASAEDEILDLKYIENTGSCFTLNAVGCAKFVTSIIKGLKGDKNVIEWAYVRQTGHIQPFLPYMASVIRLGPDGVDRLFMPKLNEKECENLQKARLYIKKQIELGKSYINGECPNECRMVPRLSGQCDLVSKKPVAMIGDVVLDPDMFTQDGEEKCIEVIT